MAARNTKSFQSNLYKYCCLLISITFFAVAFAFYQYNSHILKQNLVENTVNTLDALDTHINSILSNMNDSLKTLHLSESFIAIVRNIPLSDENYFPLHPFDATDIRAAFYKVLVAQSYGGSIHFINYNFDNISAGSSFSVPFQRKERLRENGIIKRLLEREDFFTFVPPHPFFWTGADRTVLSVARTVGSTYQKYGVLEYAVPMEAITAFLSDYEKPDNYRLLLLDSDHSVLYAPEPQEGFTPEKTSAMIKKHMEKNASGFFFFSKSLAVYKRSNLTGWTVVLNRDISSFTGRLVTLGILTVFAFFFVFIVVAIFLFLLTRYLTSPLRNLRNEMLKISDIVPEIKLTADSENNEIVMLARSIQDILNQILAQNRRLMEAKQRELHAHYSAMEAQLNPHFLYNTLSVIGAAGIVSNNINISEMCSELSNLLRYSISYSGKAVSLEQEIHNIKSYLYIMQKRYEDSLVCQFDIDHSLDSIHVPKLILQPIIENCFQHGFRDLPPPWKILVKTYGRDGRWYISVTNNGLPFDAQKKEMLAERLGQFRKSITGGAFFDEGDGWRDAFEKQQGMGLENTVMRLAIFCNGNVYLNIDSPTGEESLTAIEIGGSYGAGD